MLSIFISSFNLEDSCTHTGQYSWSFLIFIFICRAFLQNTPSMVLKLIIFKPFNDISLYHHYQGTISLPSPSSSPRFVTPPTWLFSTYLFPSSSFFLSTPSHPLFSLSALVTRMSSLFRLLSYRHTNILQAKTTSGRKYDFSKMDKKLAELNKSLSSRITSGTCWIIDQETAIDFFAPMSKVM